MVCAKCGAENASTNRFCHKCGAALSSGVDSNEQRNAWSPSKATIQPKAPQAYSDIYASFWARIGAYVIDYIVFVVISFAAGAALGEGAGLLAMFVAVFLYDVLMVSSSLQGTVGKLALGIKVTDLAGERISFARSVGRFFAEWISALTLCIGYVMAAFTEQRQTLHDKIAGTLVVRKSADEETVASAGPAGPVSGGAIVAIVLLVLVIPITGILAAIAIPAYQDYTIRAQVAQGLMLAGAHKDAVSEAWNGQSIGFDEIDDTVLGERVRSGTYVESIEVQSGAVVITFGGQAHQQLQGKVLTLVPAVNENVSEMVWVCGYGNPPAGFATIFEDSSDYSDVPRKYMPSACRGTTST